MVALMGEMTVVWMVALMVALKVDHLVLLVYLLVDKKVALMVDKKVALMVDEMVALMVASKVV
jgi:hypothetical protein